MTGRFQGCEIHNVIAESNTRAGSAIVRFENAEWQVLQRKMRIRRDFDKRTESHNYNLTTKITKDTKRYFFSYQELRDLRVLRGD